MVTICALYQFVRLDDFEEFRTPLRALMDDLEIKGTLLLALEGLNGTVIWINRTLKTANIVFIVIARINQ
jgi:predicted sulfurtransferase